MARAMSTQIAVRLPEEMVDFLDRLVAEGKAPDIPLLGESRPQLPTTSLSALTASSMSMRSCSMRRNGTSPAVAMPA